MRFEHFLRIRYPDPRGKGLRIRFPDPREKGLRIRSPDPRGKGQPVFQPIFPKNAPYFIKKMAPIFSFLPPIEEWSLCSRSGSQKYVRFFYPSV